jgi:hypothetical protein
VRTLDLSNAEIKFFLELGRTTSVKTVGQKGKK